VSPRPRCTLLELIQKIQDSERGDDEVVATIARLIESGRVVLCNAFSGTTSGSAVPDANRKSPARNERTATARNGKIRFAR